MNNACITCNVRMEYLKGQKIFDVSTIKSAELKPSEADDDTEML